ncbi:hypothetical protein [Streptomyces mirabilis]|uniref:hypothetical protein n=1 Tax=Streptomyces mirabilis TaxID=68239 RepID=UPI003680154F
MEQVVDAPADKWLVCVLRQDRLAGLVPSAPEDRPGPQAALLAGRQEVAGLKTVPLDQIAEDGDERGGRGRGDIKSSRTVQPSSPPVAVYAGSVRVSVVSISVAVTASSPI